MTRRAMSDYRVPPAFNASGDPTSENTIMGWVREAIEEGEGFLKNQPAYPDIERGRRIIEGRGSERLPKGVSDVYVGRVKRASREIVATEANLRPLWGYKSDNRIFYGHAEKFNKLLNGWWHNTFADRQIRKALQWAVACGTAYISPVWEPEFWTRGRGDVALKVYGPEDVLPIQLPPDHDLQRAYAVAIRTEQPLALVHAMYPEHAARIKPSRDRPTWWRNLTRKARRYAAPALNLKIDNEEVRSPTVDVYHVYILDLSRNMTDKPIWMGDPGTSWHYEVPAYRSDIPTPQLDSRTGQRLVRKATNEDAALYPLRRLIIATEDVLLKDGPSPWWSGKVPAIQFRIDDWPWAFLGFAPVRDGGSIEDSINRLYRLIDNSANSKLDPAMTYDETVISEAAARKVDPRRPRQRIPVKPGLGGEPMKPLLAPEYYNVESWIWEHIGRMEESLEHVMAARDLAAVARARQIPAADTMEKLLELAGPIVQDISRGMEASLMGLGDLWLPLALQFYTSARTVQILGEDDKTEEPFDYDPSTIFPARMPEETEGATSVFSRMQRGRDFAKNFMFHITPNSAHRITQMSTKLMMIQLWRGQFPVDPWTVAEALDVPNFGPAPVGTNTVIERWVAWIFMRGEMQSELQKMLQGLNPEQAVAKMVDVMQRRPQGRPPTGQKPPRIVQKDQGTRSSIVES